MTNKKKDHNDQNEQLLMLADMISSFHELRHNLLYLLIDHQHLLSQIEGAALIWDDEDFEDFKILTQFLEGMERRSDK